MTASAPRAVDRPRVATLAIYGTGIGLSAFLLFSVEPLVGRLALPVFGGVPAAWATVLAFFQGILLLGYLYGHVSVTRLGVRRGALVHVGVAVAAFGLLLAAPADWATLRDAGLPPALNLLAILAITIGPAAFLLTATTPLLSAWYAAVRDAETPGAVDPYWLYALSNGASLAALLAYPLLFEPTLGLTAQRALWIAGIGVFIAIVAAAAVRVRVVVPPAARPADALEPRQDAAAGTAGARADRIGNRRRLRWFVLAAIPTGLLTAVTTFIATDLVSAPLLWVGPLAIYLASFVVAFSGRGGTLVRWATICAPAAATLLWVPLGIERHLAPRPARRGRAGRLRGGGDGPPRPPRGRPSGRQPPHRVLPGPRARRRRRRGLRRPGRPSDLPGRVGVRAAGRLGRGRARRHVAVRGPRRARRAAPGRAGSGLAGGPSTSARS